MESRVQAADGKGPGFRELHRLGTEGGPTNPIRETVFGRDAGHARGDDHVTRASDAMDRGHGIDGDGQREPGRSPAGRIASSTASRAARAVPAAVARTRRPRSRRCPTSTSGRSSPFPLPATTPATPRENCRNPRATRLAEPAALAVLDPATAGGTMIGQARRSRDFRRRPGAEIESQNYWCRDVGSTRTEGRIIPLKSEGYGNPC